MKKIVMLIFVVLLLMSGCSKKEETEEFIFEKVGELSGYYVKFLTEEEPYLILSNQTLYLLEDNNLEKVADFGTYLSLFAFTQDNEIFIVSGDVTVNDWEERGKISLNYLDDNYRLTETIISDGLNTNEVFSFDRNTGEVESYICELENCGFFSSGSQGGGIYYNYIEYSDASIQILYQWNNDGKSVAYLFDLGGMKVVSKQYSNIYKVSDRYGNNKDLKKEIFIVEKNGLFGLVDKDGVEHVPLKYKNLGKWEILGTRIFATKEYIVAMNSSGKYGVINWKNEVLIDFQFDDISWVLDKGEHYIASKKGKYGVVDCNGDIIIDFLYDEIVGSTMWSSDFIGYYAVAVDGQVSIFDENGAIIDTTTHEFASYYQDYNYDYFDNGEDIPFLWEISESGPYLKIMVNSSETKFVYMGIDGIIDDINKVIRPEILDLDYEGYYRHYKNEDYYIKNKDGEDVYGGEIYIVHGDLFYVNGSLDSHNRKDVLGGRYVFLLNHDKQEIFDLKEEKVIVSGEKVGGLLVENIYYFYQINEGIISVYDTENMFITSVAGRDIMSMGFGYFIIRDDGVNYVYRINYEGDK